MDLKETLGRKVGPLPVWGWGAVGLVGSFGLVWWLRKAKGSGSGTPASTADNWGAANQQGSGGSSYQPFTYGPLQQTDTNTPQTKPEMLKQPNTPKAAGTSSAFSVTPSNIISRFNISNPVSSLQPSRYYTASTTDVASTQPGGIDALLARVVGSSPSSGQTYTQYGTQTGSGAIIAEADRITGERYDADGRVIY